MYVVHPCSLVLFSDACLAVPSQLRNVMLNILPARFCQGPSSESQSHLRRLLDALRASHQKQSSYRNPLQGLHCRPCNRWWAWGGNAATGGPGGPHGTVVGCRSWLRHRQCAIRGAALRRHNPSGRERGAPIPTNCPVYLFLILGNRLQLGLLIPPLTGLTLPYILFRCFCRRERADVPSALGLQFGLPASFDWRPWTCQAWHAVSVSQRPECVS
jgi:hypothetical protein